MKVQPRYAENIIVFTIFKGVGRWYVSDKDLWYLDLRKLIKAFEDMGYAIPNPEDFSDRFGIDILSEKDTIEKFFVEMSEYEVLQNELTSLLVENAVFNISGLVPSLFINFDLKTLYSYYPEPASFEKHIPDDWEGYYKNIVPLIPDEYKYWIVSNENLLTKKA